METVDLNDLCLPVLIAGREIDIQRVDLDEDLSVDSTTFKESNKLSIVGDPCCSTQEFELKEKLVGRMSTLLQLV